jgi:hypothetical protein
MNTIREIDERNFVAVAEASRDPGAAEAVEGEALLPPTVVARLLPDRRERGRNPGPHAAHGVTRWVMGLEAVPPTGRLR